MNILKRLFPTPVTSLNPLETALLKSVTEEPTKWFLSSPDSGSTIRANHNERGVGVFLRVLACEAFNGRLVFSPEFSQQWFAIVCPRYRKQVADAEEAAATNVRLQLERAMGL